MHLSSFIEHTDIEYKIISWGYFRSLISIYSRYLQHDEDKRKLYERERTVLEKRYTLPDSSHIIVHPSRMAKSGKFDCTVMSLSVLLDYRPEDTKVFYTLEVIFTYLQKRIVYKSFEYVGTFFWSISLCGTVQRNVDAGFWFSHLSCVI